MAELPDVPPLQCALPEPPACPSWCTAAPHGWDESWADPSTGDAVKKCQKSIGTARDRTGRETTVGIMRWAEHDPEHGLRVSPAEVVLDHDSFLAHDQAVQLADLLRAACEATAAT